MFVQYIMREETNGAMVLVDHAKGIAFEGNLAAVA